MDKSLPKRSVGSDCTGDGEETGFQLGNVSCFENVSQIELERKTAVIELQGGRSFGANPTTWFHRDNTQTGCGISPLGVVLFKERMSQG